MATYQIYISCGPHGPREDLLNFVFPLQVNGSYMLSWQPKFKSDQPRNLFSLPDDGFS